MRQTENAPMLHSLPYVRNLCSHLKMMGKTVCVTNGAYDLFHEGHLRTIQDAAGVADILIVAINSDASMRAYKRPPIIPQSSRAAVVAALKCVDIVVIFDSPTCDDVIRACRPEYYAKSTEYQGRQALEELLALTEYEVRTVWTPIHEGLPHTSEIIQSIKG